ncbi:MAG: C4-dicarboxylate ABC transporter [Bauldia sp.]
MTIHQQADATSRRSFLKKGGAVLAGAAVSTLAAPAVVTAQAPIVLKMQAAWGPAEVFMEMAKQYVDRVQRMSGGRLRIDLLPAGAVAGAFQVMDAVNDGVVDGGHDVCSYWYGKSKTSSLFGTGPVFGGNPFHMLSWIYSGGGKELYRELTQDNLKLNVVSFFAMPMPMQPLGWFKKPITAMADMRGLKYRTVGLAADLMQSMGLTVLQLAGGDIVPSMDRGVIDAFEFNNPTADRRFGAQDVAKNYMMGSYHQPNEFFEIMFNKRKFDTLPDDLKAILEHAAEASSTMNFAHAMDNYSKDLQWLMTDGKVTVRRTPKEILNEQLAAWDKLLTTLNQDPLFKKIVDSQKAWCERVVFYDQMNTGDAYRVAYDHYFPGKLPA